MDKDAVSYRRLYGVEQKGKRLSMVPGSYIKDGPKKSGKGKPLAQPPESSSIISSSHAILRAVASTAIQPLCTQESEARMEAWEGRSWGRSWQAGCDVNRR